MRTPNTTYMRVVSFLTRVRSWLPLVVALLAQSVQAQDSTPLLVRAILDKYAKLPTYTDKGTVDDRWIDETGETHNSTEFETRFIRGQEFSIEFSRSFGRGRPMVGRVLLKDGRLTVSQRGSTRFVDNLSTALAMTSSSSARASHVIPKLLMPDIPARSLFERFVWVEKAGSGGNRVLVGRRDAVVREVHVDKETLLIVKVVEEQTIMGARNRETRVIQPGAMPR